MCGLGSLSQNKSFSILVQEWSTFFVEVGIQHLVYFDEMKVSKVPDGRQDNFVMYRKWWLGVGTKSKFRNKLNSNPSTQFKHYSGPPRVVKAGELRPVKYLVDSYINDCEIEASSSQQLMLNGKKSFSEKLITNINAEEKMEQNLAMKNLKLILQQLQNGGTTEEKSIELIIASIQESRIQAQENRMKIIDNMFASEDIGDRGENEVMMTADDLLLSVEAAKKKAPLLCQLGAPIKKSLIQVLLKEIVSLSNAFPHEQLLSYTHWNGQESNLLSVPICKNEVSFLRTNRGKSKWLDHLPSLVVGNCNDRNDEESVKRKNEAAGWILNRFGRIYENEFVATAEKMGYSLTSKKMDEDTADAMWQDANVGSNGQRVILRYLRGTFGRRCMISSEYQVDKLRRKILYDPADPICGKIKIGKEKITYWTKAIIPALNFSLTSRLTSNGKYQNAIKKFDFVMGGDHGQRKFRMVLKIIGRAGDNTIVDSWVIKVAHIDCVKDTYEVLKKTISESLNACLNKLLANGMKVNLFQNENDKANEFVFQIGKLEDTFLDPQNANNNNNYVLLHSNVFRFFMTGDLAFYASCLGRQNMASVWCMYCQLSRAEWESEDHGKRDEWTLESMRKRLEELNSKLIKDTSTNRRGVVDEPLFESVRVDQYIIPILHTEIGLGNSMLKSFFDWIDYRVEIVSDEEKQKRNDYAKLSKEIVEAKKNMLEPWCDEQGIELADLRTEKMGYELILQERDDNNNFIYSVNDRKECTELKKLATARIKGLEKERNVIDSVIKTMELMAATLKKELSKYQKDRGKRAPLRESLEDAMAAIGINRPVYHGGDLEGGKIQVLFQNIDKLFGTFKDIIMNQEDKSATDEEVAVVISMFIDLGFVMDGVFSLARTPCGQLTATKINLMNRMCKATMKLWRYLRLSLKAPKIHGIEDHMLEHMIRWNGIGCFVEDFVEQAHQVGVKEEGRTKGMTNKQKQSKSHSDWERVSNDMSVRSAQTEIRKKTSRKRKRGSAEKETEKKLNRDHKRLASLLAIEGDDKYSGKIVEWRTVETIINDVDDDENEDDNEQAEGE